MRGGIFVTGGSGFVGTRLLPAIASLGRPVFALLRSQPSSALPAGVTLVRGDLRDPSSYRAALSSCDTVVHLAAATGKASAAEHRNVNVAGTEVLLSECRAAGVSRFLFVSSIAAAFPANIGYHYADAKRHAEAAVAAATGLKFLTLRPTIVLGPGAPILGALEKIARLPIPVIPGNGRVRVQPIHVDDVVAAIVGAVRDNTFANEVVELGGPETLTMEDLILRLRRARTGRPGGSIHVPLGLLRLPLRVAEAADFGRFLPMTAGQLSSFQYDGVASPSAMRERMAPRLIGVDAMLADTPRGGSLSSSFTPWIGASECQIFTRHLVGLNPDAYVDAKYRAAIEQMPALAPQTRFDRFLVAFAAKGAAAVRVADAYAAVALPGGALRKRLVLLLAILETRPPFHQVIDAAPGGSAAVATIAMVGRGLIAVMGLIAGAIVFIPARLVMAVLPARSS